MRLIVAIITAAFFAGCGSADLNDVKFQEYRTSLVQSYQGSPAKTHAACFQESSRTLGSPPYSFFYQRIEYESGDAFVACSVIDSNRVTGSDSYFANTSGVTDGSCAATHSAGTWTYAHSGATTSVSVSSSDAALNGWAFTLSDCATQN